jgi:hypothetical protein
MARPKKYNVDVVEVEKLASYGCTTREIADFFGCPENVISGRYKEFTTKGRNSLKKRLRMLQIQAAQKGNVTMLIWLGKNYLEQSDKNELDMNVNASEIVSSFAQMVSSSGAGSAT